MVALPVIVLDLRNVFHEVLLRRSGDGSMPWSARIAATVVPTDLAAKAAHDVAKARIAPTGVVTSRLNYQSRNLWRLRGSPRPTLCAPIPPRRPSVVGPRTQGAGYRRSSTVP